MYGINQGDLALNSGNYDLSYQGNNLTITKALLNVIADGKTKVYGDADPSLTYQVSGLKNGDTAGAVLNGGSLSFFQFELDDIERKVPFANDEGEFQVSLTHGSFPVPGGQFLSNPLEEQATLLLLSRRRKSLALCRFREVADIFGSTEAPLNLPLPCSSSSSDSNSSSLISSPPAAAGALPCSAGAAAGAAAAGAAGVPAASGTSPNLPLPCSSSSSASNSWPVGRIPPQAVSADTPAKRRITASGYSPYGVGVLSGVSGVCRANNAMGVIRRCRG